MRSATPVALPPFLTAPPLAALPGVLTSTYVAHFPENMLLVMVDKPVSLHISPAATGTTCDVVSESAVRDGQCTSAKNAAAKLVGTLVNNSGIRNGQFAVNLIVDATATILGKAMSYR